MKNNYRLPLTFLCFLGIFQGLVKSNLSVAEDLDEVIREATKESHLIANEIERWLIQEAGSAFTSHKELRQRRSSEESNGDKENKQSLSNIRHFFTHRSVREASENPKKLKHSRSVKKDRGNSHQLLKKEDISIQADKHRHLNKGTKGKKEKKSRGAMDKHAAKQIKRSKYSQDRKRFELVTALIGSSRESKAHRDHTDEKAYRQLVEDIASTDQSSEETNKKSNIAKPLWSPNKKGKREHGKMLSKKRKRILTILQNMPRNVLRNYLHKKGLDNYWKVIEKLRKENKQLHNKAKIRKHQQISLHEKEKLSKSDSSGQDQPKKLPKVNDKSVTKKLNKAYDIQSVPNHKIIKHSDKHLDLPTKRSKAHNNQKDVHEKIVKTSLNKQLTKDSQEDKVALNDSKKKSAGKEIVKVHSDHRVKKIKTLLSNASVQSGQNTSKENASHVKKVFKNDSKTIATKAVNVKSFKKAKEIALGRKDVSQNPKKTVNSSQDKDNKGPKRPLAKLNDLSLSYRGNMTTPKPVNELKHETTKQVETTIKHLIKAKDAGYSSKETSKRPELTDHRDDVTSSKHVSQTDKHEDSLHPTQQMHPMSTKIDYLKDKIRKTNNLKFRVAQALLAHCETQNRLRQVFDEVNASLKKAASLARAIGNKFGIKQSDIDKMTSEHTEDAVQQFLKQLF